MTMNRWKAFLFLGIAAILVALPFLIGGRTAKGETSPNVDVPVPTVTIIVPGPTIKLPVATVTVPGATVNVPGPTIKVPVPNNLIPRATTTVTVTAPPAPQPTGSVVKPKPPPTKTVTETVSPTGQTGPPRDTVEPSQNEPVVPDETPRETIVKRILLGTIASLVIAVLGILALYLGYYLGYRDARKDEGKFLRGTLERLAIRHTDIK